MPKGFDKVTSNFGKLRLIMRVGGLEKDGKTHFALTAPGDIGVIDLDRGLEGVIQKFVNDKDIYAVNFRDMPIATQDDHEARWTAFEDAYGVLLKDPKIRTIIWDTDTEAWEMIRMAKFGRLTKIKSHHYGEVNAAFRNLIDRAFDADKNLIMIARYKKQYVKKSPTSDDSAWNGAYEAGGFTEAASIVQVNLRAKLIEDEDGELMPSITVVNCRQNMKTNGEVFEGDMATFPWVATSIIEGTSPEDWE